MEDDCSDRYLGKPVSDRRHWLNFLCAAVCIGLVVCFIGWCVALALYHVHDAGDMVGMIKRAWWTYRDDVTGYFASPWVYAGVPLAFLLTWLRPAIPSQRTFSREVLVDLIWSLLQKAFYLSGILLYFKFLSQMFETHLSFLVIPAASNLGAPAQILLGYLAADFLGWMHHLVRHKVPFLWSFHQFHHAQTELNPFSRERVHPLDYLFAQTVRALPLLMFQNSFGIVVTYLAFHAMQDTLNHSNIRTSFGPLRHVFVTPQFHRVHHSTETRHFDSNFGVSLAIWDRLFRTAYHDHEQYPLTGVPDPTWPPNARSLSGIPVTMWRQFWYPFVSAARTLRSPRPTA
jgi:sterol desaturase/sphingolipid hydroxylase (fatty acid hydroxylase superfamily)